MRRNIRYCSRHAVYVRPLVTSSLLQSLPGTSLPIDGVANTVALHAGVSKLALFSVEPTCSRGCVGKQPEPSKGDNRGNGALEDEEPLPALEPAESRHASKDTRRNQSCEASS